jgi:hypothetical protein
MNQRQEASTMKTTTAVALGALSFCALTARASNIVATNQSTIVQVDVYTEYGNGDTIVWLASNSLQSSCPSGFWVRGTDTGADRALAQIEAAYHTGTPVTIWADTSTIWSGSSSAACLIWLVRGS